MCLHLKSLASPDDRRQMAQEHMGVGETAPHESTKSLEESLAEKTAGHVFELPAPCRVRPPFNLGSCALFFPSWMTGRTLLFLAGTEPSSSHAITKSTDSISEGGLDSLQGGMVTSAPSDPACRVRLWSRAGHAGCL
ncbi:hypothetical protein C0Q70_16060 [Pomacea canaliculata]|uniref:Uncharacterized protein n=1 Tax=Pomacea canaliculata TaxID=400727 RepID=A0A2T7NNR3_POMCA|nr:hypothetical protein C0Q70_16060 [Pomacea canaliculata]